MTNVMIVSGFLGAGKTTLIRMILDGMNANENTVIIENEFGEVSVDTDLLRDTKVEIKEMVSGCICCSLSGDFTKSIGEVVQKFHPQWIIIEPSGVGKLSDVLLACEKAKRVVPLQIKQTVTVLDCLKYAVYLRNFREFYLDQILYADALYLRNAQKNTKQQEVLTSLQTINPKAILLDTPLAEMSKGELWQQLDSLELLSRQMMREYAMQVSSASSVRSRGAEEVFQSWGELLTGTYSKTQIMNILQALAQHPAMQVLRAKGIFMDEQGNWHQFSYVPEEAKIEEAGWHQQAKVCVIGMALIKAELNELFGIAHD